MLWVHALRADEDTRFVAGAHFAERCSSRYSSEDAIAAVARPRRGLQGAARRGIRPFEAVVGNQSCGRGECVVDETSQEKVGAAKIFFLCVLGEGAGMGHDPRDSVGGWYL